MAITYTTFIFNPQPGMQTPQLFYPPPPPPPTSSSISSFPILAISIIGILSTAILLVSYYVFVSKCCFNWPHNDLLRRLSSIRSRRRRTDVPLMIYATMAIESRGLEESVIRAIPIFQYKKEINGEEKSSFHECAVCLTEFQEEERLRLLPSCSHAFHVDCIDTWLQTNANCPLCRSEITSTIPAPTHQNIAQSPYQEPEQSESVVIEVRDDASDQTPNTHHNSSPRKTEQRGVHKKVIRKLNKVSSMRDEVIDVREKDEQFSIQPMRRSFSMDSSSDRQLYISVQEILQQNPHFREVGNGEGSSSSSSSARVRRSFFSFGHGRSSRNAVLPIQIEL